MITLYLATCLDEPYALGRTSDEAKRRAEKGIRASHSAMFDQSRDPADLLVDLSVIDADILPLPWSIERVRGVLGGWWGDDTVEAELEAIGLGEEDEIDLADLDEDAVDLQSVEA